MDSFKKSTIKSVIIIIGCVIGLCFTATNCIDDKPKDTYAYECKINSENHNVETLYVYEIHTIGGFCDTVKVHDKITVWRSNGCSYTDIAELNVAYFYVDRIKILPDEVIIK